MSNPVTGLLKVAVTGMGAVLVGSGAGEARATVGAARSLARENSDVSPLVVSVAVALKTALAKREFPVPDATATPAPALKAMVLRAPAAAPPIVLLEEETIRTPAALPRTALPPASVPMALPATKLPPPPLRRIPLPRFP